MDLTKYIRDIPDFPKPGILFKDITPLLAEPAAFQAAIDRMAEHYRGQIGGRRRRRRGARLPVRGPAGAGPAQAADTAAQAGQAAATGRIRSVTTWNTAAPNCTSTPTASTGRPRAAGRRPAGHRRHHEGGLRAGRKGRRRSWPVALPGRADLPRRPEKLKPHEVFSLIQY